jgi:capsular polysaccharide transport system permease protein
MNTFTTLAEHSRIVWALMLRELSTRYGRDNLGFLWVIGEPLVFTVGVLMMWRALRGPYENGLSVVPFVFTGYMPMILVRHIVMYSLNAAKINSQLLYHRNISVLDLFLARMILEFVGVTLAFFVILSLLLVFGLAPFPADPWLFYQGWFADGLTGCGLALVVGAISEVVEIVERIIAVTMYLLVPISGTFFMADWLPPDIRRVALLLPFLNCSEMIRAGFFGPAVNAHFDFPYTITFAATMVVAGLLLLRHVRARLDIY